MEPSDEISETERRREFWNDWNARYRSGRELVAGDLDPPTLHRGEVVLRCLDSLELTRPRILEVGCSSGWLAEHLVRRGPVTGLDVSDRSIEEARRRVPSATFLTGDFLSGELPRGGFDVLITLETIASVEDQRGFIDRAAEVLAEGGHLILTTQNPFVFERKSDVEPRQEGQIRRWLSRRELRALLAPRFRVLRERSLDPAGHGGVLRAVNSYRLNVVLDRFGLRALADRAREACGLGQTLLVLARKRPANPGR